MVDVKDISYGNPSLLQKIGYFASALLHMPLVVGWSLITSPFHPNNRHKTWRRIIGDNMFYHLTNRLNAKQLQWNMGTPRQTYEKWAKAQKIPVDIEEIGDNARLFWVGERRTDRLILYFHGGAFIFPLQDFAVSYWKHVQDKLEEEGKGVSLVILSYSLVPTATFPTQLKQAINAVQHLISKGVSPQDIQLVGDSAGGNLILQLLSHILHPVPDLPPFRLPSRFRGIYVMSPWVSLTSEYGSMVTNDNNDCVSRSGLLYWGEMVLGDVSESARPYLEAVRTPEGWFNGISNVMDRFLISAGDAECLRDDIIITAKKLEAAWTHPPGGPGDFKFILQERGVHDDPHLDFFFEEKRLSDLSKTIVEWLSEGFS